MTSRDCPHVEELQWVIEEAREEMRMASDPATEDWIERAANREIDAIEDACERECNGMRLFVKDEGDR